MLSNAYFLAKFRFDTAENEPAKTLQQTCQLLRLLPPLTPVSRACRCVSGLSGARTSARRQSAKASSSFPTRQFTANFQENVARFQLYRHRSLQANTRFSAFFKIYKDYLAAIFEIDLSRQNFAYFATFAKIVSEFARKLLIFQTDFFLLNF